MPAIAGCYSYVPPQDSALLAPAKGVEVQLDLTDSGSVVLAPQVGPGIASVRGQLLADSGGRYLLSLTAAEHRSGETSDWKGEHVAFPRPLVASVGVRQFSRSRTILMGLASVAALFAVREAFQGAGGSNAPGPTPGGPPPAH